MKLADQLLTPTTKSKHFPSSHWSRTVAHRLYWKNLMRLGRPVQSLTSFLPVRSRQTVSFRPSQRICGCTHLTDPTIDETKRTRNDERLHFENSDGSGHLGLPAQW